MIAKKCVEQARLKRYRLSRDSRIAASWTEVEGPSETLSSSDGVARKDHPVDLKRKRTPVFLVSIEYLTMPNLIT